MLDPRLLGCCFYSPWELARHFWLRQQCEVSSLEWFAAVWFNCRYHLTSVKQLTLSIGRLITASGYGLFPRAFQKSGI